jgi:hypothetical protein
MAVMNPINWPRDKWIIGDTRADSKDRRREYIVHLAEPMFVARVVSVDASGDPEPNEEPADLLNRRYLRSPIYSR